MRFVSVMMPRIIILLTFLISSLAVFANDDDRISSYFTNEAPVIDGVLNDKVWQKALSVTGFKSFTPDYEQDLAFKTVAYWSHDDENLYFAFKCYDEPNMIKTSVAARDRIGDDDWVCINLDSFNDRQTLYGFYINPNGIQMDSRFAGGRDDNGIDMVWYSAGQIDEDGYTVEVKIPFKSIRYAVRDGKVDMGVIFERKMSRFSTQGTYPALDPDQGMNFLNQTMPIQFEGVKKSVLFEAIPAVTYSYNRSHAEGEYTSESKPDAGLTLKYGITSDLILDATINPDFSQVEADAMQVEVNQRFAVFYPERRPFFLEGNENFNHAGGSREIRSIVNTRTIVNPVVAGKVTGKIGGLQNTISAIAAVDEMTNADYNGLVGVLRYKRTLKQDSYVGGFLTARQDDYFKNIVYGGDAQIRLSKSTMASGHIYNSGTIDSIGVDVRNKLATAANISYNTRKLSMGGGYYNIDDGFESAVGYITRTGIVKVNARVSPKFYPSGAIKRIEPMVYLSLIKDKPSGLFERTVWSRIGFTLDRNTRINLSGSISNEVYKAIAYDRGSISINASSQINKRVFVRTEVRRQNRPYYSTERQGYGYSASANLNLQLSDNFNSEWEYRYTDLYDTETNEMFFDVHIFRSRNTYQINKYLFVRLIVQYNSSTRLLAPNFLTSFTYIPGTVIHLGYGSNFVQAAWDPSQPEGGDYVDSNRFMEMDRGLFFKASYLFRAK